jgi:transcriptional regulator with XRE-family HTH domain
MEDPIAKVVRKARAHTYDSEPFVSKIKELLKQRNQSYREAALAAGLDHQGIRRILAGQQPSLTNCILLANYFGVNPNEFLQLAGWPTLKVFEVEIIKGEHLPQEAVDIALAVSKISNPITRKQISTAVLALIAAYFGTPEAEKPGL